MNGHTFGFHNGHSMNGNGLGAPHGRPSKGRMPWSRRDGGGGRGMAMKWKIAVGAVTLILLHLLSVNVLFPLFTHHTIGSTQDLQNNPLGGNGSGNGNGATENENNGGGIIRLLSEKASSWTSNSADGSLTKEQASVLARYGDKNFRGEDIMMQTDGFTNPLILPPGDADAAKDPSNVQQSTHRTFQGLYKDKCGNSTLLPYNGGTGREWVTTSRAWARHYGSQVSKYRWCRGGSNNEVPELKQVLLLKSTKPRPKRAVTVVTQLSLERSQMLEQQCSLWPHPIAAVVYIPLLRGRIFSAEEGEWNLASLESGVNAMKELHAQLSALPDGCILDLEVVVEECCNKDIGSMYPTNAVRNRALHLASTDVVLLLDADFVVDLSLARKLEDPAKYQELVNLLTDHRAMVLPAFEAWDQGEWGKRVALEAVHQGKEYISKKFMYNVVIGFHMAHYPQGHEKTNFWRWMNTTEAYEVDYQIGFEPYIMLLKKYVPYYDERFRGYYWNKVQQLMHISMQNAFKFVIHPEAFVVHAPHRKPSTKVRTRRSGQKERNHVMFLEALEDMKHDRFVPVTGFPHLCLPPELQQAAATVAKHEIQKETLLTMADVVKKVPSEELKGGGAEALARARGQVTPQMIEKRATVHLVEDVISKQAKQAEKIEMDEEEMEHDENAAAGAARMAGSKVAAVLYPDEMDASDLRRAGNLGLGGTNTNTAAGAAEDEDEDDDSGVGMEEVEEEEDDELLSEDGDEDDQMIVSSRKRRNGGGGRRNKARPIVIAEEDEDEEGDVEPEFEDQLFEIHAKSASSTGNVGSRTTASSTRVGAPVKDPRSAKQQQQQI